VARKIPCRQVLDKTLLMLTHEDIVRQRLGLRPRIIGFRQLLRQLFPKRAPVCIICADYAPEVVAPAKAQSITDSICEKCQTDRAIMCAYCGHAMASLDNAARILGFCRSCVSSSKRIKRCCACRRQKQTHANCDTHDVPPSPDVPKAEEVHAVASPAYSLSNSLITNLQNIHKSPTTK
jgi:hypothetical protein